MDSAHGTFAALQIAIAWLVVIRVKILYENEWVQYPKQLVCLRGVA